MSMTGLDSADRQRLAEWLDRVRHAGIDAVIDFAARPWGSPDLEVVIDEIMSDKITLDFENASLVETKEVSNEPSEAPAETTAPAAAKKD